jgi:transposase
MDNLPAHKVAGAREATETAGVDLLYLQPNFRGLNPIEMASSKRKSILRAAAPRSAQDPWQTSRRTAAFNR